MGILMLKFCIASLSLCVLLLTAQPARAANPSSTPGTSCYVSYYGPVSYRTDPWGYRISIGINTFGHIIREFLDFDFCNDITPTDANGVPITNWVQLGNGPPMNNPSYTGAESNREWLTFDTWSWVPLQQEEWCSILGVLGSPEPQITWGQFEILSPQSGVYAGRQVALYWDWDRAYASDANWFLAMQDDAYGFWSDRIPWAGYDPVWCVPEASGNAEQTVGSFTDGFCQKWVTSDGYCWLPATRPAF
jgi:hypothetical protein